MGYNSVITMLVEKGAKVNIKNSRGQTPLTALTGRNRQAADSSRSSTVELLRKLGATD
jgi:hypothetical protein